MSQRILVAGSLNMDLVVTVARHPNPGDTVLGSDVHTFPGGKGANQAVAAAKAGGDVSMLGLVGNDAYGEALERNLRAAGVDTGRLGRVEGPSGMAFITVSEEGENMIVVSPGANGKFDPERFDTSALSGAALVMMQLEIPLRTVEAVAEAAAQRGVPVLLNPAPARDLPDSLLSQVGYLVLNEGEAALLSGRPVSSVDGAMNAARVLHERGVSTVVVTLGDKGVVWSTPDGHGYVPAFRVDVVDTTAAGDAFCGGMAVRLSERAALEDAVRFGGAAGALATTREGAQPSLPDRDAVDALLREQT